MAKKNDDKIARVRYEKSDGAGSDRYILERYDWDEGEWEFIYSTPFVQSQEYPEAGKNFIHYNLLVEVLKWQELGYRIHL